MKSFTSFETIYAEHERIEDILENYMDYYAHTHTKKPFEKLHAHVHLVMEYALKLAGVHELDNVVDSLILEILEVNPGVQQTEKVGNFIKRLFLNALVFHDYGKVNENFQIEKMKNTRLFKPNTENGISSQHSVLSAFIFLNVHLNEIAQIKGLNNFESNLLAISTLLFASPILKHHASFLQYQVDFEQGRIDALSPYLELYKKSFNNRLRGILSNAEVFLQKLKNDLNDASYFSFFTLLKLNFSLLTASDYYATNDFMQGMPVNDFGWIDSDFKNRLVYNFANNDKTPYNAELLRRLDYFYNLAFTDLQDRSNKNLNLLRQKMAAEAIMTLRQNTDKKLFYLEAPTGGGKTNMSFACALELLQADEKLNNVYYVFPFTTLITQTFASIKQTLKLKDEEVIQLHSKAGFHSPESQEGKDGVYGGQRLNYINNLFINYPFTLLSHIKFFDILKGNGKDVNYILHRMSNSIVIIDELQTYAPKHWDKIIFYMHHYAKHFNIRFIVMSATLPKIDNLSPEANGKITPLLPNKHLYFNNPNFRGRVTFDFSLLGKSGREMIELNDLADFVNKELERYAGKNANSVNGLVEFIIKKSASAFHRIIEEDNRFKEYEVLLISGTILEPRRQEIIKTIQEKTHSKTLVITTQVVEAGVDIDMDIGFKDKSLIDSDEQLAGRVNRNASKDGCRVFIFNYDREVKIYGKDKRYEITRDQISKQEYEEILNNKDFDRLYDKVHVEIDKLNKDEYFVNLSSYKGYFKAFDFRKIHEEFRLIENNTTSVFVPLEIDRNYFSENELKFLDPYGIAKPEEVCGANVFDIYRRIVLGEGDFIQKMIDKKQIAGILSKFMFSIYSNSKLEQELKCYCDAEILDQFGIIYLSHHNEVYSYEGGIDDSKFTQSIFI